MKKQKTLDKKNIQNILPLTALQEGLLFHYLKDRESDVYFEQLSLHLSGEVDFSCFKQAWIIVGNNNDVLRTIFRWEKLTTPVQIVLREKMIPVTYRDFSENDSQTALEEFRDNDRDAGIDITGEPIRIALCKTASHRYTMIISHHHILYDGWSNGIMLKEFFSLYNKLINNEKPAIPPKAAFSKYIQWLKSQKKEEQQKFWSAYFKDFKQLTGLPETSIRTGFKIAHQSLKLDSCVKEKIEAFTKSNRTTLAVLFYTVWAVLLQKYNNVSDVAFGTTVSGREIPVKGIENTMGLFINTPPLRLNSTDGDTVTDVIKSVEESLHSRSTFMASSLAEITAWSGCGNAKLFNSIVVIENYPLDKALRNPAHQLTIDAYEMFEKTNFDLTLTIEAFTDFKLSVDYNTCLYSSDLINQVIDHFVRILSRILASPGIRLAEIDLLSRREKDRILVDYNRTQAPYPADAVIHELFEKMAGQNPGNTALEFSGGSITYEELNRQANYLAQVLLGKGVKSGTPVAMIMNRSPEMIIGIMAVLKAGGAYLPVDPDYPQGRIEFMLEDSGAVAVLSTSDLAPITSGLKSPVINADKHRGEADNPAVNSRAEDLAYIIYTSGSTGKPKGVMLSHRNAVNILTGLQKQYPLLEQDAFLLKTTYTFDVSVAEIFGWFWAGGRLVILDKEGHKDPAAILAAIDRYGVTHVNFVPSMFKAFLAGLDKKDKPVLDKLKYIFLAGEAVSRDTIDGFLKITGEVRLENLYGPTEGTIYATGCSLMNLKPGIVNVPIGKPLQNVKTYIVDQKNRLQIPGVAGELCLAGAGIARGYLNRPQLNAQRFVRDPFSPEGLMYRTGDLARWLPDGSIEFLGRMDHQVKVRGFRIELGEIESRLEDHPGLQAAAVLAWPDTDGSHYLCAYIVCREEVKTEEWQSYLAATLPDYMVPSRFVILETMPLSSSGKIDRKALREPKRQSGGEGIYEAPAGEVEEKLAAIWQEVLGVAKIGVQEDFFALGGHSLKSTVLVSRIHKAFDVSLSIKEVFMHTTIRKQSDLIKAAIKGLYSSIPNIPEREYYALSSAQKRMYVLWQLEPESTIYNMPGAVSITGKLDRERLTRAFETVVRRHESLRTTFEFADDQLVQRVHRDSVFSVEYTEGGESRLRNISRSFLKPFDLNKGPLLRVNVIKWAADKYVLLFDMHHIISDGQSLSVIIEEVLNIYGGKTYPGLRIQYRDFASWQNEFLKSDQIKKQRDFWMNEFASNIPVLDLPLDFPRPPVRSYQGKWKYFDIRPDSSERIRNLSRDTGTTLFHILLAAYNVLLSKYSGQEEISIGCPVLGRPHADLENMVGMFVNTLALRNYPGMRKSFKEFLLEVKERSLAAFENQDYPFEELVESLELNKDLSRNPLFDTMLAMVNAHVPDISLEDITIQPYPFQLDVTKFDIAITCEEKTDGSLAFSLQYCSALFREQTMERFIRHYVSILERVCDNPALKLGEVDMLDAAERRQLLFDFNDTAALYDRTKTIHGIFEERAAKNPGHTALSFEGRTLSYRELNERANSFAHNLKTLGVGRETIVGIIAEPSPEMIAGLLGILKAGGAYLPLRPDYPENRILGMIEDSGITLLVADESVLENFSCDFIRRIEDSQLIPLVNSRREQIKDFDNLSIPDRSLVDYEKYNRYIGQAMVKNAIAIQATRGCPYNCAYCHKIWPKKHVVRSAENIFSEVSLYYGMGVRRFVFIDDIFNLNKKNSLSFFNMVIEKGLDIQIFFPNGLRGDILTPDYIDTMVRAGTVNVALALETASPRLQKLINKNLNLEKFKANVEYFAEKYPHVILELFTMHGFPSETEEEARMTLDFIKSIKWLHFPYVHILKIYPGTDMAELAMQNGVAAEAIEKSVSMAFHELPDTLPFPPRFTLQYQAEFLNEYFILKERLLHVLPQQMKSLTEDEIVQKYDSYLPAVIGSLDDLLEFAGLERSELGGHKPLERDYGAVADLNRKLKARFPAVAPAEDALNVLLLDLSQHYTTSANAMLYDVVEPPLGLMYLMTNLKDNFGSRVRGKLAKARIDFDSNEELLRLVEEFKPDVIGIRTLTFYSDFFHKTTRRLKRQTGGAVIMAGGPYATSSHETVLRDSNVDLVVLGEGERTFCEIIGHILENGGKLPGEEVLAGITGLAYTAEADREARHGRKREVLPLEEAVNGPYPTANPEPVNEPEDMAYIIYTSGSTGKPKGVVIEHRNVVRLMFNDKFQFDFDERDVWSLFHSFCFDFSVWEMYGALLYGGRLAIVPKLTAQDTRSFLDFLKEEKVTVLNQTPSAFYNLANEELAAEGRELNIRYIIYGGEALKPVMLKGWHEKYPETRLINMYGITETTVHVTYKELGGEEIEQSLSNIGKPIPTLTTYVMDRGLNLVPVGVAGELLVGGDGVARGYLNREQLTAERFIANPHIPGERLYRSGDLVRWLENGDMEYLGRIDHQVKIRGFRVELGEIEKRLLSHTGIEDAVVIVRTHEDGDKYLCAYLVSAEELAVPELRNYLLGELPDYMVPAHFVRMDKIPMTGNNKVDRRALPEPGDREGLKTGYTAPENPLEERLAGLWREILKLEKIGVEDNFFELGGHSLKATILISRVHKEQDVYIPLKEVFARPTIRGMAEYITASEKDRYASIKAAPEQEDYPVSSAQKRMYILWQWDKDSISYNIPIRVQLEGQLDVEGMRRAFKTLIMRHEAFRTSFHQPEEEPVQRIADTVDFELEYVCACENAEEAAYAFTAPFDLSCAPLFRARLLRQSATEHILLVDMHHIISDGVSMQIIVRELLELYRGKELAPLRLQYKDYAVWQKEYFLSAELKRQKEYWLSRFASSEIPVLDLPTDYPRPGVQSFDGGHLCFEIPEALSEEIRGICQSSGTTLFMFLLAAYNVLLSKYSGQSEIIVGCPIAERPHADLENIIGMFVNTLAIKSCPSGDKSFAGFLAEVKETCLGAYENQDFQFEELVEELDLNRDTSRNPLFDTMFVQQEIDDSDFMADNLRIRRHDMESRISKFDLTLTAVDNGKKIKLEWNYATALFRLETIKGFRDHFIKLLEDITSGRDTLLRDLDLLSQTERNTILSVYNRPPQAFPEDRTIHELFEIQAAAHPDRTALVFREQGKPEVSVSYAELNARANYLARILRDRGVHSGVPVAMLMERSPEMIIGIMAVLKAGGAYLPVDPAYPPGRVAFMLEDSGAAVVLSTANLSPIISGPESFVIYVDEHTGTADNPGVSSRAEDLAYIIYTSGSTGKPKGVMLSHRNAINILTGLQKRYPLLEGDAFLLKTTYTFDVSVAEIFGWFQAGGRLVILDKEGHKDPAAILEAIDRYGVTHINFVPSMFKAFLAGLDKKDKPVLDKLKYIFLAGEAVTRDAIDGFLKITRQVQLENLYGPTEATIYATGCSLMNLEQGLINVPIGKPLQNVKAYIMNQQGRLQVPGVAGELCLAGAGIARGYLNRPELNQQRFVTDPFDPAGLMYKTGDLARWLPDGSLEFLGRMDHQVKVRGFRIELGEIENRLEDHAGVEAAAVLAWPDTDGSYSLCAYVVCKGQADTEELRGYLAGYLPDYMIPSLFVILETMPLSSSGKIDRKALPEPERPTGGTEAYEAPAGKIEEKLAAIWQEVLGVEKIGVHDDFFSLGGHSLKSTVLVSKIHKAFDTALSLKEVFLHTTIRKQAALLQASAKELYASIPRIPEQEYYPVSSAQKRMYVLWQLEPESTLYNMPGAVTIAGELDRDRLAKAFNTVVRRHESLRTTFEFAGSQLVQRVHRDYELPVEYIENADLDTREIPGGFLEPFDLNRGPLIRLRLILRAEKKYVLLCDMHHIISDGVSVGIVVRELVDIYQGRVLTPLPVQYRDFASWQNELSGSAGMLSQKEYWLTEFADGIPESFLPLDYPRPPVPSFAGAGFAFDTGEELGARIRQICQSGGTTLFMFLLAVYNILLSKYGGHPEIIVGSPITERPHADLENIVGMFINTLALKTKPAPDKTFGRFLQEVKETCLRAYENRNYQFEDLVEELGIEHNTSRNPLFDTMFSLQNFVDFDVSMDDLSVSACETAGRQAKFDITLTAMEKGGNIQFELVYATDLFKEETMIMFRDRFLKLLTDLSTGEDLLIEDLTLLTEAENQQIMTRFNATRKAYPENKTIIELFADCVRKYPENSAIVYPLPGGRSGHLTYAELDGMSNQLATHLRAAGVDREMIVAVLMEPSAPMLTAILGILKAGGAFLPLDPDYPQERIKYILHDSEVQILLSDQALVSSLDYSGKWLDPADEALYTEKTCPLPLVNASSDLVYVIYTSGSTGNPKGVMVEHRSLVNLCCWHNEYYRVTAEDRSGKYAGPGFDASVWEIFPYLISGATIYLIDEELRLDVRKLNDFFEENGITISFLPTHVCEQFMQLPNRSLRNLLTGGDKLKYYTAQNYRLINNYGPTENTVVTTCFPVDGKYVNIPIGKPLANVEVFILDKSGKLQPVGVPGELCISGAGLARGYLNRPELTFEKFINNPFRRGQRLYRTGDLARWLPDGNLEFLGRIDTQVKIRGFRIELGEIETCLLNHHRINAATVVTGGAGEDDKYLCAYVVAAEGIDSAEIKSFLATRLPGYMIPPVIMNVARIPLTANGKVDYRALPEPVRPLQDKEEYVAPSGSIEEKMQSIWQEVLGRERISVVDDFYDLGGNSLDAVKLITLCFKEFNAEIPVREVLSASTIRKLSAYIKQTAVKKHEVIPPVDEMEFYPVSSAQKRMYMINMLHPGDLSYNMNGAVILEGCPASQRLEEALRRLIARHETLRTAFLMPGSEPVQKVQREVSFKIDTLSATWATLDETLAGLIYPFSLNQAPLLRFSLIQLENGKYALFYDMHHIISDGISLGILIKEFIALYNKQELPALRIQYKDYALWHNNLLESAGIQKQEQYWLNEFGDLSYGTLPRKKIVPGAHDTGMEKQIEFDQAIALEIEKYCKKAKVTKSVFLLTIFKLALFNEVGYGKKLCIGLPVAGRNYDDLDKIIGMFLNVVLISTQAEPDMKFTEYLDIIRSKMSCALEYQDYPYERLNGKIKERFKQHSGPLFSILYNFLPYQEEAGTRLGNIDVTPYTINSIEAKYDLTLYIRERKDTYTLTAVYKRNYYEDWLMEGILSNMKTIIGYILGNEDLLINELGLNKPDTLNQFVMDFDDYFDNSDILGE